MEKIVKVLGVLTLSLLVSQIAWAGDYADYGDAPDPPYCSYFENGGARAINSDAIWLWLGENINLEFNSWQVDMDLYDDGVVFNTPYVPGDSGSVDVTVSAQFEDGGRYPVVPSYLAAWFDWNQDNDWDDSGENVFSMMFVAQAGTETFHIAFLVPSYATNDDMWTRFRVYFGDFDTLFALTGYCGWVEYGEVEDYLLQDFLSVGLSTFYASAGDGQATLYWTTQSEVNNLGFYLMRGEGSADYVRVNEKLVPGHGTSEARHEYSYTDRGLANGVKYYYKVVDVDFAGTRTSHGPITVTPQASVQVPTEFALSQNYPNPFNAQTTIAYAIPEDSDVSLKVFNVLGEEVRTLVAGHQKANAYQVTWDGRDADGRSVASGVYFCTLEAGEFSQTTKMVFMK